MLHNRVNRAFPYEFRLMVSFGAVVLLLALFATGVAANLFHRSQANEENRLCGAISLLVSQSLAQGGTNPLQVQRIAVALLTRVPELAYVSVESRQGVVLAHSDPARVGLRNEGGAAATSIFGDAVGVTELTERLWAGRVVKEAVVPYQGRAYGGESGIVRVGVHVDATRAEQRANLMKILLFVSLLTLAAIAAVIFLGRFFGGATARLAGQLRGIFDNTPVPLAIVNDRGRLLLQSAGFDALLGTAVPGQDHSSGSEALGGSLGPRLEDMLPEPVRRLLAEDEAQGKGAGVRTERELNFSLPDGEHCWHYLRFPIAVSNTGEVLQSCVFIRDISEAKASETRIRAILNRLRSITDTAPVVIYEIEESLDHELGNRFTFVSEKVQELLGISSEQMVADPYAFFSLVHKEDQAGLLAASDEAADTNSEFCHEFRVVLPNSPVKWVRGSSRISELKHGRHTWSGYLMDITDSKLSALALMENEQKFRTIFNNCPLGVFRTTYSGRFVEVNATLARMLGYESPAELMDHVSDVGTDLYYEPVFKQRLRQSLLANPAGARVEVEFKRRDGTRFFGAINASLSFSTAGEPEFLEGTIEDVNERKRSEERLRQSEEKFSRLFRLSPDSISLADLDTGELLDVNETFLRMSGFTREEVIGRTTKDIGIYADDESRKRLSALLLRDGHVVNFETEARYKDGSRALCLLSSQVIDLSDKRYRLTIVRDITTLRRMQEMMVQTEKMISVGGIAAGIAHEINNPLGIVLQAAQTLLQRTNPDFKKNQEAAAAIGLDMELLRQYFVARNLGAFIDDIMAAAVRASAIIRHMLDFSRKSESHRTVCDLPGIIDKAVELAGSDYDLKKSYDFRKIRIVRDYADDLPRVNCTETEMEQVMLNILRNAAQAMASAMPAIEAPAITIVVRATDEGVRIQISDNGPGMNPEVRRRVFEPFYTTKAPGVGTGLGLSVSYYIITQGHGGNMLVESRQDEGASFIITLPTEEALATRARRE